MEAPVVETYRRPRPRVVVVRRGVEWLFVATLLAIHVGGSTAIFIAGGARLGLIATVFFGSFVALASILFALPRSRVCVEIDLDARTVTAHAQASTHQLERRTFPLDDFLRVEVDEGASDGGRIFLVLRGDQIPLTSRQRGGLSRHDLGFARRVAHALEEAARAS